MSVSLPQRYWVKALPEERQELSGLQVRGLGCGWVWLGGCVCVWEGGGGPIRAAGLDS